MPQVDELTTRLSRELRRAYIGVLNAVASSLFDDAISAALRRSVYRLIGVRSAVGSRIQGACWVGGSGLVLGPRTYVGRRCYFDLTAGVVLGADVVVGHGSTFITAEHELGESGRRAGGVSARAISVGAGAWIGANCTLLPGVVIGSGSVIAAGSTVVSDVPSNVLVGGVPAGQIRRLGSTL